jgi:hypothetical protein
MCKKRKEKKNELQVSTVIEIRRNINGTTEKPEEAEYSKKLKIGQKREVSHRLIRSPRTISKDELRMSNFFNVPFPSSYLRC